MGKMHKSMQGRLVDMEKLMNQNELMPAVGNVKVNARGDELGPGGKIIRKREDIMSEYYEKNPKAQPSPVKTKQERASAKTATPVQPAPVTASPVPRNSNEDFGDDEEV